LFAVADWWLGKTRVEECEAEAAATPTRTTESAKRRMASFIVGNLSVFGLAEGLTLCTVTE